MKRRFLALVVMAVAGLATMFAQVKNYGNGLQEYKLSNGLTVYLWEDNSVQDVFGRVVVRAGSLDEPADYTGLAHYLEHMMFKGTETIGALDWAKEKPIYDSIIDAYSRLNAWGKAHENDKPSKKENPERLAIIKEINELSLRAAKFGATNDFSNLTESFGGDELNAFTSYDLTAYHSTFPPTAMEKWIKLNSDRLINPVFRSFQAELENVFEEYNMYNDDMGTHQRQFIYENLYANTPYDRDVIGYAKHLKNPSLQALIDFYHTWYVPNNMCLLLVGNFNSETAKPLIEQYFGRLEAKELPARIQYTDKPFPSDKAKLSVGYMPQYIWAYKGVKMGHADETTLDFAISLLNNSHETGLLDRLMLDGEVGGAYVSNDERRIAGRIMVIGVPYYDMATRSFDDIKTTQKLIYKEIEKIKNPNTIPDWLFNSVKEQYYQNAIAMMEYRDAKVNILTYSYTYQTPIEDALNQAEMIRKITKEDVAAIAKKYFDGEMMLLEFAEGEPKKNKLAKPAIKPLDPPKGQTTAYAVDFKKVPTSPVTVTYSDMNDVKTVNIAPNVKMNYTPNTKNGIFTLTFRYGVGSHVMPELEYAAELLNTAGYRTPEGKKMSSQDLHRQYSELGATYSFGVSDSYFFISIQGDEKNLDKILSIVGSQIFTPELDDKQIKNMIQNAYWSRFSEKRSTSVLASALYEYIMYGEQSRFIDRIPMTELYHYTVHEDGSYDESFLVNKTTLTTTILEATGYALDIFYCGQKPVEEVKQVMINRAPKQEKMRDTQSPFYRTRQSYDKTQIYFLHDSRMQQAKVYFYVNATDFSNKQLVDIMAFNQYFSGGFSGLVMNEIREKRSMAYTAYGSYAYPGKLGDKSYLIGYVGTQSDKVADAVDVMMDLITNMPEPEDKEARMEDIRTFLYQSILLGKPSMRGKASTFEGWRRLGFNDDPSKTMLPEIEKLTYEDIVNFYQQNIVGKPITIIVIGDQKLIDKKKLESKYGKFVKVSSGKLFKGGVDEL